MTDHIGSWVARIRRGHLTTRFHVVESEIADRLVTRCGRQLGPIEGTELRALDDLAVVVADLCSYCQPKEVPDVPGP